MEEEHLKFSEDWFSAHASIWMGLLKEFKPRRILEIGSFEGRSTCFIIGNCAKYGSLDIFCIDTWQGGVEHAGKDFNEIEAAFDKNVSLMQSWAENPVHIHKRKGLSSVELSRMIVDHVGEFDLIYVDGSHEASDVFLDAALAFKLLRVGGCLIFDDYRAKHEEKEQFNFPHLAIDCFIEVHRNKIEQIVFQVGEELRDSKYVLENGLIDPNVFYQMYIKKISN